MALRELSNLITDPITNNEMHFRGHDISERGRKYFL